MPEPLFEEAYKKLNPAQKEAVDAIEGPVMVIAGPGTGKTQILALRIANILKQTDTPPDAILALTFTEAGASAMRKRLLSLIGSSAYRVNIFTFHGYATYVIGRHPDAFPHIIGAQPADDGDQIAFIREALIEIKAQALRPAGNPEFYISSIRHAIGALKSDAITPQLYEKFLHTEAEGLDDSLPKAEKEKKEKKIARGEEFLRVYQIYERLLQKHHLFDFGDMLLSLIVALKNDESLRLELGESAQYILADEHQDANMAQNEILELLSSFDEEPNLFIVGDEKQAIYRFQGASLENFLYFKRRFPHARVVTLTQNYRSHQNILDAAHGVIGETPVADIPRPKLVAEMKDSQKIEIVSAPHEADETEWIIGQIEEEITRGVSPSEIAILVRRNKDMDAFVEILRRKRIPYTVAAERSALSEPLVMELVMLIRAIVEPENDEAVSHALLLPGFGISSTDLVKLFGGHKKSHGTIFELLSREKLRDIGVDDTESLLRVRALIEQFSLEEKTTPALSLFDELVTQSGFLEKVLASDAPLSTLEAYNTVRELMVPRVARNPKYRLSDFLGLLEDLESQQIRLSGSAFSNTGVSVLTTHKAKGLEFEVVFFARATESRFTPRTTVNYLPLPPGVSPDSDLEDERRLFYVALTRAKKRLVISTSLLSFEGREEQPSRFIYDVEENVRTIEDIPPREILAPVSRKIVRSAEKERAREQLVELFFDRGISATALNNYCRDPWDFFFRNLLCLPEEKAPHLLYGSAIHDALRRFFEGVAQGESADKEKLLALFRSAFTRLPLSPEDRAAYLEKGINALSGYFDEYHESWEKNVRLEVEIEHLLPVGEQSIRLVGCLDKVEYLEDGVRIVDYKTGKPKSRNEILGNTQNSDGSYKRQLVFYRLLMELGSEQPTNVIEAMLDFIEPNERGNYKRESFVISDAEVAELKETIQLMVEDVRTLSFLTKKCESEDPHLVALSEIVRERLT